MRGGVPAGTSRGIAGKAGRNAGGQPIVRRVCGSGAKTQWKEKDFSQTDDCGGRVKGRRVARTEGGRGKKML